MIKCLFLVEGPYDKQRLILLANLFDKAKLEIFPFGCDMLSEKDYYKNYIEEIKAMLSKEKTFKIDDFNTIVQVCDLDGCFIKDEFIIENKEINKIRYNKDSIEAIDRDNIIERNHRKKENIDELLDDNNIYLFYNSTNIDHVFDNIQNPGNNQKKNYAINMYNKYKNNEILFLEKLFSVNTLKSKTYIDSWEDAKEGFNSLVSNSNLIFFIDMFKECLKEEVRKKYLELKDIDERTNVW